MTIQLIPPVNGPITQLFGENPSLYKQWGYAGHNGIDYGIPNGTPVKAAAEGTVASVSFESGGYGNFVKISHKDGSTTFFTYYAHLASMAVSAGQKVKAGTVVGASDNTGASTGPHLHFGLKIEGQNPAFKGYLDPMPCFQAAPSPTPSTPAVPAGTAEVAEMQFEVDAETLNVRNGPGVEFTIVGKLTKGTKVAGKKLNSRSAWIEFEPGKWCALVHDGTQYLKLKK